MSGKIFLTSDLHFGHDREFIWKVRGYNSCEEMNKIQIEKWNTRISDEDDVYVLGDLMLGTIDNIKHLERLKGNIHIVLGNHDTLTREILYKTLPGVVEIAEVGIRLDCKRHHFALTHYPMLTGNLEKESLKQMTCNFYGHTHQTTNFYNDMPFTFHVGVDSHNGYPVEIDEALEEMYNKAKECIDYL